MRTPARPLLLILCLSPIAACTPEPANPPGAGSETVTAATLGQQSVRPVTEYLAEEPYASASPELGRRLLMQCRACHTLDAGGAHMLGPNLNGVFGRNAGSVEDFDYSDALASADFTWTPRALEAWLQRPNRFLPGNRMTFAGVPHAADRDALIAALLKETGAKQ